MRNDGKISEKLQNFPANQNAAILHREFALLERPTRVKLSESHYRLSVLRRRSSFSFSAGVPLFRSSGLKNLTVGEQGDESNREGCWVRDERYIATNTLF